MKAVSVSPNITPAIPKTVIRAYLAKTIAQMVGVPVLYVILGKIGLSFSPPETDTTPIWPPVGFAIVVLLVGGARLWPAITIGSLLVGYLFSHLSFLGMIGMACVDTIEALTACILLRRIHFNYALRRVRDVVALLLVTALAATVVGATLGTTVFLVDGQIPLQAAPESWLVYWVANATACLTLSPLLLTWITPLGVTGSATVRQRAGSLEAIVLCIVLGASSVLIWISDHQSIIHEFEFMLFPILIGSAIRFGSRVTSLAVAGVALIAIWGTAHGTGPFAEFDRELGLFLTQTYVAVFALSGHLLAAVSEERSAARDDLSRAKDGLEIIVRDRTEAITRTNSFLNAILDNVSSEIVACDSNGQITLLNRAVKEHFGAERRMDEFEEWSKNLMFYSPHTQERLAPSAIPLIRALRGETLTNEEVEVHFPEAPIRTLLVSGQPIMGSDQKNVGAVIVAHDITDRKHAEEMERLIKTAALASNEAPDEEQAILTILEVVSASIGWPIGHALRVENLKEGSVAISTKWWYPTDHQAFQVFQNETDQTRFLPGIDLPGQVLLTRKPEWVERMTGERTAKHNASGDALKVVSGFAFPVMAGPQLVAIVEFFTDKKTPPNPRLLEMMTSIGTQIGRVYERAEARQKLVKMTMRDPLTSLPNRLAFIDIIKRALMHAKRRADYAFAVLFLDLDRFKSINDSLGHAAGDEVLLETARRITQCLREGDVAARLGGDEFTIFLADIGQRSHGANASKAAQRILAVLSEPFVIDTENVFISASIGIAVNNRTYLDPEELLRDADVAMYRAKAAGKSRFKVFSEHMHIDAMTTLRLESDLRKAMDDGEFIVHYQPIISLTRNTIVGFEALIRWNHAERGMILPMDFIPMCEEMGIIIPLGQWVLNTACKWLADLGECAATTGLTINVNVSGMQFAQNDLETHVHEALVKSGLHPGRLNLEIVESTLMGNAGASVATLTALRKMGVRVIIDDFGTGYSSLSYLAHLPIDALKIDRSFVADMITDKTQIEIVRCIIAMASAMELAVIAEGIETREQADALQTLGCTLGQGFYYSRPLEPEIAAQMTLLENGHFNIINPTV